MVAAIPPGSKSTIGPFRRVPKGGLMRGGAALLWLAIFFSIEGARDLQPQVTELQPQGLPGDPKQAGGRLLFRLRVLHDQRQQELIELIVRLSIEVTIIGP